MPVRLRDGAYRVDMYVRETGRLQYVATCFSRPLADEIEQKFIASLAAGTHISAALAAVRTEAKERSATERAALAVAQGLDPDETPYVVPQGHHGTFWSAEHRAYGASVKFKGEPHRVVGYYRVFADARAAFGAAVAEHKAAEDARVDALRAQYSRILDAPPAAVGRPPKASAKLTDAEVAEMRADRAAGATYAQLATVYGVSCGYALLVCKGRARRAK